MFFSPWKVTDVLPHFWSQSNTVNRVVIFLQKYQNTQHYLLINESWRGTIIIPFHQHQLQNCSTGVQKWTQDFFKNKYFRTFYNQCSVAGAGWPPLMTSDRSMSFLPTCGRRREYECLSDSRSEVYGASYTSQKETTLSSQPRFKYLLYLLRNSLSKKTLRAASPLLTVC